MLSSFPMSSIVSEQPTTAVMSKPIEQLRATENRCCQCCVTDVERQHHKSHSSRLRKLMLPTAFALLVVLIGLLTLNCVRNGHFSGLELDELLPRNSTGRFIVPLFGFFLLRTIQDLSLLGLSSGQSC
jgi:hypothetical protein